MIKLNDYMDKELTPRMLERIIFTAQSTSVVRLSFACQIMSKNTYKTI